MLPACPGRAVPRAGPRGGLRPGRRLGARRHAGGQAPGNRPAQAARADALNDVIFIAGGSSGGGGSDILVGALVAGAADGMVGNVLQRLAAEGQGFHTIHSFADAPDLQGGVVTTDHLLQTRPDVVRRFLTAAVKGVRVMAEDPETSLDVLLRYVELDRGEAAKGLGYVRPLMSKDGLITPTEQRDGLDKLKEAN